MFLSAHAHSIRRRFWYTTGLFCQGKLHWEAFTCQHLHLFFSRLRNRSSIGSNEQIEREAKKSTWYYLEHTLCLQWTGFPSFEHIRAISVHSTGARHPVDV